MTDCPFCGIADKTLDAVIACDDSDVLAFLDRRPIRDGHRQVIPRQHVETFEDMSPQLASKVPRVPQQLARKTKALYKIDRVAFLFTVGHVPHVHAHILPMHEKTDITSARYIVNPRGGDFRSAHLQADQVAPERAKRQLRFD